MYNNNSLNITFVDKKSYVLRKVIFSAKYSSMKVRLTQAQKIRIANTEDIFKIMHAVLMRQNRLHRQKEYFWSMGLNTNYEILYLELCTVGTLNQTHIDGVELFSFAVQKKCKKLILIHNHPSGNLKPSEMDKILTEYFMAGGRLLGIEILDHLIISEKGFYSMKDSKTLPDISSKMR